MLWCREKTESLSQGVVVEFYRPSLLCFVFCIYFKMLLFGMVVAREKVFG